jgi:tRNA U38,U39,U40 pseudouridine synthase TruA
MNTNRIDAWFHLAFFGALYHGSQSQGGLSSIYVSIEDVLNSAFKAFALTTLSSLPLPNEEIEDVNHWTFTTASRLDAHVNAKEFLVRVNLSRMLLPLKSATSATEGFTESAKFLRERLNSHLPDDVQIKRIRLCRPSQIQLRRLELTKQYSFYIRTGGWRETATQGTLNSSIYEKKRIDLDRIVEAFRGVGGGVAHNYHPFAAIKREKAGEARKGDKDSVRAIDRIIVSVLRPSECRFTLDEPCPDEKTGIVIFEEPLMANKEQGQEQQQQAQVRLRYLNEDEKSVSQPQKRRKIEESSSLVEVTPITDVPKSSDEPCILRFVFVGKGFLRHMLRRLAGAALMIGKGMLNESYIRDTLAAADHRLLLTTAMNRGLSSSTSLSSSPPLVTGAATDYLVLHGRGLWLERMNVPDGFWTDENWCNNTRDYCKQHGLVYLETACTSLHAQNNQSEQQEGIEEE